jgi:hypothetical protein
MVSRDENQQLAMSCPSRFLPIPCPPHRRAVRISQMLPRPRGSIAIRQREREFRSGMSCTMTSDDSTGPVSVSTSATKWRLVPGLRDS